MGIDWGLVATIAAPLVALVVGSFSGAKVTPPPLLFANLAAAGGGGLQGLHAPCRLPGQGFEKE